jgi:hypothetical protein
MSKSVDVTEYFVGEAEVRPNYRYTEKKSAFKLHSR